jgi:hypothetical protein
VHPGQLAFFAEGYPRPGQPGEVSFDYDCVRGEEADPSNRQVAGDCSSAMAPTNCGTLSGLLPTERSGANVNPMCGSQTFRACNMMGQLCIPQDQDIANYQFRCR